MVYCVEGFDKVDENTPGVFVVFFPRLEYGSECEGPVLASNFGGAAKLVSGS